MSAALARATGMGTAELARRYLFDPVGVTAEHWGRDPQGYDSGGYNVYLTARELLTLGQLFLRQGRWKGREVVPPSWIAECWQRHQTVDARRAYGYLWWLVSPNGFEVRKMWGYGGQFVYVVPALDLVVVLTADTKEEYPELDGDDFLARHVLAAADQGK